MTDVLPAGQGGPLIVAAALVREGAFFAARRTYPPTLAGLWEFPGGKCEPGEDAHTALRRECREELGVEIAVHDEVRPGPDAGPGAASGAGSAERADGPQGAAGDWAGWTLANGLRMRVFRASLLTGEPRLTDAHDDGAWLPLDPAALEVPWIPADVPIVERLLALWARQTARGPGR
ncbi:(deoxy)nucleoside triphosphate pyrophosphohydrolase [Falsarthrobacter nasiphocae]|uniref:8-oxo-dGTP diphosphatase n=1 Tax=Falsarthrobacter nasiphocae TaxID=189863 RepID=A0AAE3YHA3_9MICC|nr:NUDIX domain-containing protein [Falsarthrobacter nasiphocae]MDR6892697.1 8-oxo-dGTP diphosphatase [Falsarthrobacter nasiphocae]